MMHNMMRNGIFEAGLGLAILILGLMYPSFAFALGAGALIVVGVYRMQEHRLIPSLDRWIMPRHKNEKAD